MKPTWREFLIASPYTLPLWIGVVLYCYHVASPRWDTAPPEGQISVILFFCIWCLATLKALPKVGVYYYQKRKHARAGRDPELVQAQRTNRRRRFEKTVVLGLLAYALYWLSEHRYADNPSNYVIVAVTASTLTLLVMIPLCSGLLRFLWRAVAKLSRRSRRPEKPFVVAWCLPVPRPAAPAMHLPEYCRQVLETRIQKPHPQPAMQPENRLVSH